ncbi:hypothetical protein HZS_5739 [Henneguya salminicola]|nr:hypothetical protein HZS_5739 [Henneguya salminicola]
MVVLMPVSHAFYQSFLCGIFDDEKHECLLALEKNRPKAPGNLKKNPKSTLLLKSYENMSDNKKFTENNKNVEDLDQAIIVESPSAVSTSITPKNKYNPLRRISMGVNLAHITEFMNKNQQLKEKKVQFSDIKPDSESIEKQQIEHSKINYSEESICVFVLYLLNSASVRPNIKAIKRNFSDPYIFSQTKYITELSPVKCFNLLLIQAQSDIISKKPQTGFSKIRRSSRKLEPKVVKIELVKDSLIKVDSYDNYPLDDSVIDSETNTCENAYKHNSSLVKDEIKSFSSLKNSAAPYKLFTTVRIIF